MKEEDKRHLEQLVMFIGGSSRRPQPTRSRLELTAHFRPTDPLSGQVSKFDYPPLHRPVVDSSSTSTSGALR